MTNPFFPARSPHYREDHYSSGGTCSICGKPLSEVVELGYEGERLPVNQLSCDKCGRIFGWCCVGPSFQGRDFCRACGTPSLPWHTGEPD